MPAAPLSSVADPRGTFWPSDSKPLADHEKPVDLLVQAEAGGEVHRGWAVVGRGVRTRILRRIRLGNGQPLAAKAIAGRVEQTAGDAAAPVRRRDDEAGDRPDRLFLVDLETLET